MWLSRTLPTRVDFAQASASAVLPADEAKAVVAELSRAPQLDTEAEKGGGGGGNNMGGNTRGGSASGGSISGAAAADSAAGRAAKSGRSLGVGDGSDGDPTLVIVVDCRDRAEIYADGCIRSSCHMPCSAFEDDDSADTQVERLLASAVHSQRPVFVFHCAFSQQRGPFCAQRFLSRCSVRDDMGTRLPSVYVLKGGFTNWRQLARENELVSSLTEVPP
mgnify:FL=1